MQGYSLWYVKIDQSQNMDQSTSLERPYLLTSYWMHYNNASMDGQKKVPREKCTQKAVGYFTIFSSHLLASAPPLSDRHAPRMSCDACTGTPRVSLSLSSSCFPAEFCATGFSKRSTRAYWLRGFRYVATRFSKNDCSSLSSRSVSTETTWQTVGPENSNTKVELSLSTRYTVNE